MDPVTIGLILGGNALQAFGGYLSGKSAEKAAKEEAKKAREFEERMFEKQLAARRVTVSPYMGGGTSFQTKGAIAAAQQAPQQTSMSPQQALDLRQQGQI